MYIYMFFSIFRRLNGDVICIISKHGETVLKTVSELDLNSHTPALLFSCSSGGQGTVFKPQFPHVYSGNANSRKGRVRIK